MSVSHCQRCHGDYHHTNECPLGPPRLFDPSKIPYGVPADSALEPLARSGYKPARFCTAEQVRQIVNEEINRRLGERPQEFNV